MAVDMSGFKDWARERAVRNDENGNGDTPVINWDEAPTSSNGAEFVQKAIFPKDSILDDFFNYGVKQTEGVDAYIIGSILPATAAMLGRRVWMQMGYRKVYPNLFAMLAGKAGDRKSSTIDLYHALARLSFPEEAFIPMSFSPETLFDEYDVESGGLPDKLWIVDDANIVLTDWEKNVNGERVAARFLSLYDCCPLSESYRRNKKTDDAETRRFIPETSTSIVFGATFNVACFQGHQVRMGISRRFLNYVGDGHGRLIVRPKFARSDHLVSLFKRLHVYNGEIDFNLKAGVLWESYQNDNRRLNANTDRLREIELNRLNSAPNHVQKIAIIFELCRIAALARPPTVVAIREDTLQLAIDHVDECLKAARFLDAIANRATITADAEVLLSKIRTDYRGQPDPKTILLSRSELTAKYAHHSARRGSLSTDDIYLRIMPVLIGQGLAKLVKKQGKNEVYAFRRE